MIIFKKSIFALPFLVFLAWFFYQLNFFFKDSYLIFNLNISSLIQLILLVSSLGLTCLFFVIFCALAQDYRFVLPVSITGSFIPITLIPTPISLALWIGAFLSLGLTYFILSNKLKTYIDFNPNSLLTPSVKSLAGFLIITTALAFYLSAEMEIKKNGLKIPDSLIDTALKFTQSQIPDVKSESITQVSLTPEQNELLKQNPVSPTSNQAIKTLLQTQLQNLIKPYENLIPIFLAAMFFVSLHSIFALLSVTLPILIIVIVWIFEKTGYIRFEKEMREVKKLVV